MASFWSWWRRHCIHQPDLIWPKGIYFGSFYTKVRGQLPSAVRTFHVAIIGSYFLILLNCRWILCATLLLTSPIIQGQLKPSPMLKNYSHPRPSQRQWTQHARPLALCNVRGTEERDGSKSAEDTIVNRREAEKVLSLSTIPQYLASTSKQVSIHSTHTALSPAVPVSTPWYLVWHTIPSCGQVTFPSKHL